MHLPMAGKHAVVVGRSVILGKPLALLLLQENATVTICHSRTPNLAEITRQADILCACAGKAEMITPDMVKPGAVVLDAGYNRVPGRSRDVGDVDYEGVSADRVGHHAGSRRRRADDYCHAPSKHAAKPHKPPLASPRSSHPSLTQWGSRVQFAPGSLRITGGGGL